MASFLWYRGGLQIKPPWSKSEQMESAPLSMTTFLWGRTRRGRSCSVLSAATPPPSPPGTSPPPPSHPMWYWLLSRKCVCVWQYLNNVLLNLKSQRKITKERGLFDILRGAVMCEAQHQHMMMSATVCLFKCVKVQPALQCIWEKLIDFQKNLLSPIFLTTCPPN